MSLLLQALQKASKNRDDGAEPAPDPLDSDELVLEPIGTSASEPAPEAEAPSAASAPGPAQAAAIMQARRAPAFDPMDYAREHYMIVFVALAFLVAAAYGTYVYIQVANPSWLRSAPKPVASPVGSAPPPPAAAPVAAAPATDSTAKISGLPAPGQTAAAPQPAPAPSIAEAPATPAPIPAPPAAQALPVEPAVMARAEPPARRPAQQRLKLQRTAVESGDVRVDEDGVENVVLRPAPRAAGADSRNVRPAPDAAAPAAASDIVRAYEALQAGDTAQAKALYADVLKADPKNIDALLGMGAIAWKDGRADEAGQFYQRVLELEPRNAYAQAGLISIMGGADPAASESRLRQLIAREPSAFLYFTLGNLYADQGQWPGAQQAYFQAYQSQPDNPDYAFNLAVGLEHLGQTRQALDYYRKALDLSFRKGRANFDQSLVIQRVGQLSSRVEQ